MTRTVVRALVASLLIGAAALAAVVAWLGPDELGALGRIRPAWLAAAVASFLASFLFAGARLGMLVRRTGAQVLYRHAVRAHALGLFASTVTPGGSGGMPAVALVLARQGVPRASAWSVAVAAMTADTVYYGWSMPVALLVLHASTDALVGVPLLPWLVPLVSLIAFAVAYLLTFRLAWVVPLARGVLRGRLAPLRDRVEPFLGAIVAANGAMRPASWWWYLRFHLLVAFSWASFFLILWACARGFGIPAQPVPVIAAMSIVAGVGSLFPTPGGSGFFEFGASLALVSQGNRNGVAAAVVAWRAISHYAMYLVGPMLGGYLVIRSSGGAPDPGSGSDPDAETGPAAERPSAEAAGDQEDSSIARS